MAFYCEKCLKPQKTLSLCLPCYHVAMENSRETKKNNGPLPEFHELFCHEYQKDKHIHYHQNGHFGPKEATFVSGTDRKPVFEYFCLQFYHGPGFPDCAGLSTRTSGFHIIVKFGKRKIQVRLLNLKKPRKRRKIKLRPSLFQHLKLRPRQYNLPSPLPRL